MNHCLLCSFVCWYSAKRFCYHLSSLYFPSLAFSCLLFSPLLSSPLLSSPFLSLLSSLLSPLSSLLSPLSSLLSSPLFSSPLLSFLLLSPCFLSLIFPPFLFSPLLFSVLSSLLCSLFSSFSKYFFSLIFYLIHQSESTNCSSLNCFQAMMDRKKKEELPKMQVGFIDFICTALYEVSAKDFDTQRGPPRSLPCDLGMRFTKLPKPNHQEE